jgi:hypothetical protein
MLNVNLLQITLQKPYNTVASQTLWMFKSFRNTRHFILTCKIENPRFANPITSIILHTLYKASLLYLQ